MYSPSSGNWVKYFTSRSTRSDRRPSGETYWTAVLAPNFVVVCGATNFCQPSGTWRPNCPPLPVAKLASPDCWTSVGGGTSVGPFDGLRGAAAGGSSDWPPTVLASANPPPAA